MGMLRELLNAYVERVHIEGEDVTIDDRSATPLALVFHELATNAAKYGSLSVLDGAVHLRCETDRQSVRLEWREMGGPTIAQPAKAGFGSELIELSAIRQLSGKIAREWNSDGLRLNLTIPCSSLHRAPVSAPTP